MTRTHLDTDTHARNLDLVLIGCVLFLAGVVLAAAWVRWAL